MNTPYTTLATLFDSLFFIIGHFNWLWKFQNKIKIGVSNELCRCGTGADNFCKSQAGMKTTTTTIWLPWRCSTSTITFDHKSNYLPFTHVDSIRAIETKRVENDVSILIDKKINCLGAALVIWLHQLTNNFFLLWCQSYLRKLLNFGFDIASHIDYQNDKTFLWYCAIHGYISF